MTMTCNDYEVLAERAQRDAISESERDGLERHLGECGDCREFSDLASAIGGALRRRSESAGPAPDAQRLRAGFVRRVRQRRLRAICSIPAAATIVALFGWANGPEHAWLLGGVAVVLLAIGFFRVLLPRRRRTLAALARNGDLLETYRSDLDREIKSLRAARPLVPILLIVSGLAIVVQPILLVKQQLMEEELSWRNAVAMTLVLGYLTYTSWRDDRVTLPRLEQERDEIDA